MIMIVVVESYPLALARPAECWLCRYKPVRRRKAAAQGWLGEREMEGLCDLSTTERPVDNILRSRQLIRGFS